MTSIPNTIHITVEVDQMLSHITELSSFESTISEGMPFIQFLFFLFKSYPEIEKRYPPGALAMTLNGHPPTDFELLEDGDVVKLWVMKVN